MLAYRSYAQSFASTFSLNFAQSESLAISGPPGVGITMYGHMVRKNLITALNKTIAQSFACDVKIIQKAFLIEKKKHLSGNLEVKSGR